MARLKRSLIICGCALFIFILPLAVSSQSTDEIDWIFEIEITGSLNDIDARDAVKVRQDLISNNMDISFLKNVGMVEIYIERGDGEQAYFRRCLTSIEKRVSVNMQNSPEGVYSLSISGNGEVVGVFTK